MKAMMRGMTTVSCVLTILCGMLAAAHAGTIVQFEQTALDPTAKSGKGRFYLDKNHARIEFQSQDSNEMMIYNGEDEKNPLLWLIDQNAFTYVEIRKKEVGKLQGRIKDQLELMEMQLQQMPQAEGEALKKQWHGRLKAMRELVEPRDKRKLSYEKSEPEKVNEWDCDGYKCYFDGELEDETWIASWKDVGVKYDDVAVLNDMAQAFGALTGMLFISDLWTEGSKSGIEGFPVRTVSYLDGSERDETQIVAVTKKDLDSKVFELPDGLDEKTFFGQ